MKRIYIVMAASLLASHGLSGAAGNEACPALLAGGVFDKTLVAGNQQKFEAFKHFYCSRSSRNENENLNSGLDYIGEYGKITGVLNLGKGETAQSELCQDDRNFSSSSSGTVTFVEKASEILSNSFVECMKIGKGAETGHHATTVYMDQPLKFFIEASYIPSGHEKWPTISNVETDKYTKCSSSILGGKLFVQNNHWSCTKIKDVTSSVLLTYSDGQTSAPLMSYASPKPLKPPKLAQTGTFGGACGPIDVPVVQTGRRLSWTYDECKGVANQTHINYSLIAELQSDGTYKGFEFRTIVPSKCSMWRAYDITVLNEKRIVSTVTQLPPEKQPPGSLSADGQNVCDLPLAWPQTAPMGLK